jgi:GxxExxY protein
MDGDTETTDRILRCALEVHRVLGPGLLENVYESALCIELKANNIGFVRQLGVPLFYKGELISEHRPDLIVENKVVVEVKSVEQLAPIHWAQVLTYLKVTSLNVGLLLNFNSPTLKAGTRRVVLGACSPRPRVSAARRERVR